MTDNFYFRNHLCIACECLSMNLYEFIKINNFQGFHVTLIKRYEKKKKSFTYHIYCCTRINILLRQF
jgi:hypothetical protein